MPLMGIREYGRHRNVSHVAVLKALRTGRINSAPDGLIDSDQADRDWAANTHPAPKAPRAAPFAVPADPGFARSRLVRLHYEALLAKHEYEQRVGQLLPAADVKISMTEVRQKFREAMMAIPGKFAAQVAGADNEREVYAVLASAIRAALIEFADGIELPGTAGLQNWPREDRLIAGFSSPNFPDADSGTADALKI